MLYPRGFYQDIREARETGEHGAYDLDLLSEAPSHAEQGTLEWEQAVGSRRGILKTRHLGTQGARADVKGPVHSQHEMSTKSLPGLLHFYLGRGGSRPVPHNELLSVIQSS